MRKPLWQISATLDGFMEGPDRELDDTAQVADKDFDRYASEMLLRSAECCWAEERINCSWITGHRRPGLTRMR